MISLLINGSGLTAFLKLALVIYCVRGQIDSISEYDLLTVALSDSENINNGGVTYIEGTDGFPAFAISSNANLRSHYRLIVPEKLEEFAIMATMKANKPQDGFLFAIVNSRETVIQLGLKVSSSHNNLSISLVYNDPSTTSPIESVTTFSLPYELKHWINFSIQVMNSKIILYHNCIKVHEENFTREPKELVFESASTFYLAQAGDSKQKFEAKDFGCDNFYRRIDFYDTNFQSISDINEEHFPSLRRYEETEEQNHQSSDTEATEVLKK